MISFVGEGGQPVNQTIWIMVLGIWIMEPFVISSFSTSLLEPPAMCLARCHMHHPEHLGLKLVKADVDSLQSPALEWTNAIILDRCLNFGKSSWFWWFSCICKWISTHPIFCILWHMYLKMYLFDTELWLVQVGWFVSAWPKFEVIPIVPPARTLAEAEKGQCG